MPKISAIAWWRLGLGLLALACIVLIAGIWLSGAHETQDAFDSGRRLLVTLEGGAIEGKRLTIAETSPPEAKEPETTPVPAVASESIYPADETDKASSVSEPPKVDESVPAEGGYPEVESPAEKSVKESEEVVAVLEDTPDTSETEIAIPMTPSAHPPKEYSDALGEKGEAGILPVIGKDGTKPWRYYAKPFERKGDQPMIAIIITGLGYNKIIAHSAMRLPENIALSFSPYVKDLSSWATSGRVAGHEMLIDLPMEPSNYPASDPGPHGLLISKGLGENAKRLEWLMARFSGYVGFLTPQNEAYSGNEEAFKLLLQSLANRGLLMVIGREPYKNETKTAIETSNTPTTIADMLVDEELSVASIQSRLAQLEQLAKKRGYAVGIAQSFPITIEQLRLWSESLADKGIVLAPVSSVVRLRFS